MPQDNPRSIATLLPLLLPLIPELIALCQKQGNSDEAIRAAIREPTPIQQFRLERLVRRELDMPWRQWRRERDEIMSAVLAQRRTLSDDDIDAMMQEAKCCSAIEDDK